MWKEEKPTSKDVSHETEGETWKEVREKLGMADSYLSGSGAKLFREIWNRFLDECSLHGYREIIAGENGPAQLPKACICHGEGYRADIREKFPSGKAEDWMEKISRVLERFLFQMNVPFRTVREDAEGPRWRLDVWLPVEQEYRELCRIYCEGRENTSGENLCLGTASGLEGGKLFLAVAENGFDHRGGIRIPAVLVPYVMAERLY